MPYAAKLLYFAAQTFEVTSLTDLARRAGVSKRTAARMYKLMREHHWLKTERRGRRLVPIPVLSPAEDERRAEVWKACYEASPFKGQFLMKGLGDVAAFLEETVENARPDFLDSPLTGENLEYDIFDPVTMEATEFDGFQHFGPTALFPSKEKAKQQQANDMFKVARSLEHGVNLVRLTYRDLSLDGVLKKLSPSYARRPVDRASKYVRAVEQTAAKYRRWAAKTEAQIKARLEKEERDGVDDVADYFVPPDSS